LRAELVLFLADGQDARHLSPPLVHSSAVSLACSTFRGVCNSACYKLLHHVQPSWASNKSRTGLHAESNDVIETTNGTLATNKKKKKFAEFNVGDEVEVVEISRAGQKPRSIRLTWRCAKLRLKFTIAVDAENHECVRLVHWLLILFARLLQHMPPRLERPEVSDESIAHVTHSIQSKLAAKMIDAVILAVTVGLDVPVHS